MPSYNKSRLAYYASSGDEEAVKYCLSHGRDPNAPDSEGIYSIAVPPISRDFLGRTPPTPLLQAIISKQLGCAALLLEAGADPHLSSEDVQYTPMHIYPVREDGYHYLFAYYMDETKFSTAAAANGRTARDRMFHISLAILQEAQRRYGEYRKALEGPILYTSGDNALELITSYEQAAGIMIHRADEDQRLGKGVRAHYLRLALEPLKKAIAYMESIPWRTLIDAEKRPLLEKYQFRLAQALAFLIEIETAPEDPLLNHYRSLTTEVGAMLATLPASAISRPILFAAGASGAAAEVKLSSSSGGGGSGGSKESELDASAAAKETTDETAALLPRGFRRSAGT